MKTKILIIFFIIRR